MDAAFRPGPESSEVGVFLCGPGAIGKALKEASQTHSDKTVPVQLPHEALLRTRGSPRQMVAEPSMACSHFLTRPAHDSHTTRPSNHA